MNIIETGNLLVAEPFMKDPSFMRTVVLICEHRNEGSFGLVLNRKIEYTIGELMDGLETCTLPIFYGGPVQPNSLHFIHRCPGLITGGEPVTDKIFWGGEFDEVKELLTDNKLTENDIKFFAGYSGWSAGQLEEEMKTGSWLTTFGSSNIVFNKNENQIWKEALKQMGGEYEQIINYPLDPSLN